MSTGLTQLPHRILVLDDNPVIHKVIQEILVGGKGCDHLNDLERDLFGGSPVTAAKDAFDVEGALQGQEGLQKVEEAVAEGQPFTVAFVDMRMPPGWDGLETIEHLWQVDPDVQVVICTAYSDYSWEEIVQRLGRTDKLLLLKKPFDPAEVAQVATALVHKMMSHRELVLWMNEVGVIVAEQTRDLVTARRELALLNQNLELLVAERTASVERLLRQKNELMTRLGHDLENPIMPLLSALLLLREEEESPRHHKLLDSAIQSAEYLRDLTAKSMRLAELDAVSDASTLNLEDVSLAQQIHDNLARRELAAKKKGIVMESNVDEAIVLRADRLMLQELLDNLIANAIKVSPDGGTITLGAGIKGDTVTVSVTDTGIGMKEEQLARLFDESYRSDSSDRDLDSIGLGLAISRRIVERHGGRIWAESLGEGKGSTLYFTMPQAT